MQHRWYCVSPSQEGFATVILRAITQPFRTCPQCLMKPGIVVHDRVDSLDKLKSLIPSMRAELKDERKEFVLNSDLHL